VSSCNQQGLNPGVLKISRLSWHHLPPPCSAQTQNQLREATQHRHWLHNMLTPRPTPLHSGRTALLRQICLGPSMTVPSSRRPAQTPAHTTFPDQRVLQGLSSGVGVRSHFTSRPEHTYLKLTTFRLGTKQYPLHARTLCR